MNDSPRPWTPVPRKTRTVRIGLSGVYIVLLSTIVSAMTRTSWLFSVLVISAALVASFLAILFLLVQWAQTDGRGFQVRISSLLCVFFLLAVYLGLTRWIVTAAIPDKVQSNSVWMAVLAGMGAMALTSIPFLLMVGDTLLEWAVRLVHQPVVRRWLRSRRQGRQSTSRVADGRD